MAAGHCAYAVAPPRLCASSLKPTGHCSRLVDSAQYTTDWVAWHLSLGISRLLIFDNHRDGEQEARTAMRAALAPFGHRIALHRWPGEQQQPMAYNFGFKLAADAGNATFVVVLDADELAVPFADGCLGPLVRLCRNLERCGGLSLNWRITRAATDATAARPDATLLQAAGIDGTAATVGLLHPFVKTIARVAAHTPGSFEVHNNRPRPPYALLGEDLRPIRSGSARMWTRSPPSGERAFVLHLHCIRLIDWVCPADSFISVPGAPDHPRAETCCPCGQVFRRSMRGDVLKGGIASCPTCGASLLEIERECRDTCTNAATSRGQRVETGPPP